MANDRDDDIGIGAVLAGIAGLAGLVGTGVAAYKAVKKHSNRPSGRPMLQISSKMVSPNDYSNLLDFRKIRICAEHAAYCRVIPALAAGFCKTGFIDIRTNKKRIKEYSDHISDILREDDIQTEYAKDFIIQSINEAYENSDFSIFSVNDFISSRFPENAETFVRLALGLTQHMNGAAFYSLAQAMNFIGLSQDDIESLAIEAGHSPSHIEFVKPYFESNYPMLDFRRTPVDDSYSTGTKMHLAYARLAPALATLAAKLANSDLRQQYNVPSYFEETNEIRNYPTFIFMKDAETTIASAYSENQESLYRTLKSEIGKFSKKQIKHIVSLSMKMTLTLNPDSFRLLYSFCNFLSPEEFSNLAYESGYELTPAFFASQGFSDTESKTTPNFSNGNRNDPNWKPTEYYLGQFCLSTDATWDEVVAAHRRMVMFFHPDNFNDNDKKRADAEEMSKLINVAFDELKKRRI